MSRVKLETIKKILTSEYWLIAALSGIFFFFFALNRGGVEVCIKITGFFLIINVLVGDYQIKKIHFGYLLTAGICTYLLLASLLVPFSQPRHMVILVKMLSIIFAIHCLSRKEIDDRITPLLGAVLALSVCWQFAARCLCNMPFGTYANPHYLASFALLSLPLIVYFFRVNTGWYRFIFVPVGILDADLFLQIGSRPACLAITCGALFVVIFLAKRQHKRLGTMLILSVLAVLCATQYADIVSKIIDLILTLSTEERLQFWADAWKMLKDNTLMAWIAGNGIGSVRVFFPKYSVPEYSMFVFPHNYFLEILYENGIIGAVLVFGGLGFLFFEVIKRTKETGNKKRRILLKCMIVTFVCWFIHCGLTFPFYSKYSLYPFAFILGVLLVLVDKMDCCETFVHERLRGNKCDQVKK